MACGAAKAGTDNAFGDEQLHVDLAADKIIFDELKVGMHAILHGPTGIANQSRHIDC